MKLKIGFDGDAYEKKHDEVLPATAHALVRMGRLSIILPPITNECDMFLYTK